MKKTKVVAIVGPTAAGKSDCAVKLARKFGGEVISADSRQAYRGLDIGSGKITAREMRGVPHHCLDIWSLRTRGSVSAFTATGAKAIRGIAQRKHVPIIAGGSPMYVDALAYGINFPKTKPDMHLRRKLMRMSTEELSRALKDADEDIWRVTDLRNPRRMIRAIEIAHSEAPRISVTTEPYDVLWIGIKPSRDALRERINLRLAKRMRKGLLREIRTLLHAGVKPDRLRELGLEYRYGTDACLGIISAAECEDRLRTAIWGFARRQMTWWKRNPSIIWLDPDQNGFESRIIGLVEKFIN
jgi:tRNA dimethylallyltransferase